MHASSAARTERIDYAALAESFDQGIESTLRGFRPPDAPEWLDGWVDDEDQVRSILNIFEAAAVAGLRELEVVITAPLAESIDRVRLEETLASVGEFRVARVGDGIEVFMRLGDGAVSGHVSDATSGHLRRAPPARLKEPRDLLERSFDVGPYEQSIAHLLENCTHRGELRPVAGQARIVAREQGVTLSVLVDASHIVREAAHEGGDDTQRALLEALCGLIEGRPLLDSAYHATQFLDERLRDKRTSRAAPGISTPQSSHPALGLMEHLTRALLEDYRSSRGYQEVLSDYDAGPGNRWRSLADDERRKRVQDVLDDAAPELGLPRGVCTAAPEDGDVALSFEEQILSEHGDRLRRLEERIKEHLDPMLYIHLEELKDRNQLRRL
jgi:hypothetical protein